MFKLIFLDTETTGTSQDDRLCQIAYKTSDETYCELFKPPIKIPPEASAVTHITNKMVSDKDTFRESKDFPKIKQLLENPVSVLVAHNALFDVGMVAREGIVPANFICTLRVARYLDKDAKFSSYGLQYLRYALDFDVEAQAHDAMGDVIVLEILFKRLFESIKKEVGGDEEKAVERMIDISGNPSLLAVFNFGKYNGQKVADVAKVDAGYLDWMLTQKMQNEANEEDWIYTLKHHLNK
jgi:DNA polymerase III epsilon subunit-like protein